MSKDKTGWDKYRRGPVRPATTDITVKIDSLSNNGDGIGRHEGKVVFVPFTLPGERVRIIPTTRKKSYLRGNVLETIESVSERQIPACRHFGECGGCDWQHLPYAMQLQTKTQHLADVLDRIGKLQHPDIKAIVPSGSAYHYRNRIQGVIKDGRFHFKQRGSDQLVPIERCEIAEDAINKRLSEGFEADLQGRVEIAELDGQVTVIATSDAHTSDTGFRQVNTSVSSLLSRYIENVAQRYHGKSCIDLYCGCGNWSLYLAQRYPHSRIIGVDASEQNIHVARQAAHNTGLENVRFQHGRVEKLLKSLPLSNSFCIVDPPRAGLDAKVCKALLDNPPQHIVYISCHPASLARDLQILTEDSFALESVTPLDMFPQTSHLECVSVLSASTKISA